MSFSVSEKLKALRAASGLTQEAFAELAGMDYKTYQHIEAGRRPSVRLCTIEKICDAYGIELHEFFRPELPRLSVAETSRGNAKRKPRISRE